MDAKTFIGMVLDDLSVTPRQAIQVIDALRLFLLSWDKSVQVEAIIVLVLLSNLTKINKLDLKPHSCKNRVSITTQIAVSPNSFRPSGATIEHISSQFNSLSNNLLNELAHSDKGHSGETNYLIDYMRSELEIRRREGDFDQRTSKPYIREYAERIRSLSGFIDTLMLD